MPTRDPRPEPELEALARSDIDKRPVNASATFPDVAPGDLETEPLECARTIPSAWYTDPAFHALDREAVFARTWQCVCHVQQVAEPGQFATAEVAEAPIIVVRDGESTLRAFYNVCRHRAGPLATEPTGTVKALSCKYHGWTYRLDGSLRGVPRWNYVKLFDRSDYGLIPVPVDVWDGFVFVNLDTDAPPLATFFDGIREQIAPIELATKRFAREVVYDVGCNWKVYVDNYLEGYHVPYVHPELMKLYEFNAYETEVFPHYSRQWSPLAAEENIYSSAEGDRAFYYFVYPNFMLNILPGRLQTNLVLAAGADRCRVVFRYYYDDVEGEAARSRIEEDVSFSDTVQREDMDICERVQRGLRSRAYDRGRFSVECEGAVHDFQEKLKASYRELLATTEARGGAGPEPGG